MNDEYSDTNTAINDNNMKSKLKTYIVRKSPNFFGFGIILHAGTVDENEVYFPFIEIEDNSPAMTAGLQNKQRLIAVDNQYINTDLKTVEDLASLIDECFYTKDTAKVIVLEPEDWDLISENNDLMISLYEILENGLNNNEQDEDDIETEPPLVESNNTENLDTETNENDETTYPEPVIVETAKSEITENVVEPGIFLFKLNE
jgi:hypothetical protein